MARPSKAVTEFMEKYSIDSDEIWEVHGSTWVVKHKALERVAAEQGIVWDRPELSLCDLAGGHVVILVSGKLGEHVEFSYGEAAPKNNKNAYPVAMAEKRAKDRVILKLLTSHGALYSEAEADEFTQPRQNPHVTRPSDVFEPTERDEHGEPVDNIPTVGPAGKKLTVAEQRPIFAALQKEIQATTKVADLQAWAARPTTTSQIALLKSDWQEFLRGVYGEQLTELRKQEVGDDMRMAG